MSKLPERHVCRSLSPTFCLKQDYHQLLDQDWHSFAYSCLKNLQGDAPAFGGAPSTAGLCPHGGKALCPRLGILDICARDSIVFGGRIFDKSLPCKHNPIEPEGKKKNHESHCKFISTASCSSPNPVYETHTWVYTSGTSFLYML